MLLVLHYAEIILNMMKNSARKCFEERAVAYFCKLSIAIQHRSSFKIHILFLNVEPVLQSQVFQCISGRFGTIETTF